MKSNIDDLAAFRFAFHSHKYYLWCFLFSPSTHHIRGGKCNSRGKRVTHLRHTIFCSESRNEIRLNQFPRRVSMLSKRRQMCWHCFDESILGFIYWILLHHRYVYTCDDYIMCSRREVYRHSSDGKRKIWQKKKKYWRVVIWRYFDFPYKKCSIHTDFSYVKAFTKLYYT